MLCRVSQSNRGPRKSSKNKQSRKNARDRNPNHAMAGSSKTRIKQQSPQDNSYGDEREEIALLKGPSDELRRAKEKVAEIQKTHNQLMMKTKPSAATLNLSTS